MKTTKDNIHKNHRRRMFAKAEREPAALADHEILEVVLYAVNAQKDTNQIAHHLLRRFGGLKGVLGACSEELQTVSGIGPRAATFLKVLHQFFSRAGCEEYKCRRLNNASLVMEFAKRLFEFETTERAYAICLDGSYNLISAVDISNGNERTCARINNEEAIKKLVLTNAKNVFLAHNHLIDGVLPTQEDVTTTKILMQKMLNLGIRMCDHIIINGNEFFAFAEQGWLNRWAREMLSPLQFENHYSSGIVASGGVKHNGDDFGLIL